MWRLRTSSPMDDEAFAHEVSSALRSAEPANGLAIAYRPPAGMLRRPGSTGHWEARPRLRLSKVEDGGMVLQPPFYFLIFDVEGAIEGTAIVRDADGRELGSFTLPLYFAGRFALRRNALWDVTPFRMKLLLSGMRLADELAELNERAVEMFTRALPRLLDSNLDLRALRDGFSTVDVGHGPLEGRRSFMDGPARVA